MNDASKKRDFLFVYMLILALILFVSGFYLGGSMIKTKYDNQIKILTTESRSVDKENEVKYLQTDFVSFYYGILEPFNRLKVEHFSYIERINNKDRGFDFESKSKELLELCIDIQTKMTSTKINASAPLLIKAKEEYIASLEYYQKGITALLNKESIPERMMKFNESWLHAQKEFYKSVNDWEKMYQGQNDDIVTEDTRIYDLSLSDWKTLSLHQKNYAMSVLLEQEHYMLPYQPEDITIHIDSIANFKGTNEFGIDRIGKAIDLFIAINAISIGDFHKEKENNYSNIATPLIPLYLTR